ncbi:MFS transporter [Providencia stuartii]|uniref:MFS transporter n=1 Tax=Providencia TaxID=586 RepID=UPI0009C19BFB|nr:MULTISPECIES: MFS transporter [Providencia]MDV5226153.1 MFS transporter [Providencia rettgeri]ELR5042094.1 MFS transporter [Providencia stuartii]ELR5083597.1 MFS transporter [Providencia stuartii]ELR5302086.1 MFS transporter [Providencia stuartii]MDW7590490.1 MFS transporter [Providencia sp. 2023EL-00965]
MEISQVGAKKADASLDANAKAKCIRGIVGAASGNLVEWFDFYIYAVFAAYFTKALTPQTMEPLTQSIYVWGVFAASFFMRPIGSWLFGRIADRHGRKRSMVASIYLMGFSSFLFAALPTYAQVGMLAPLLLLLVRLLQGLSVGGEYGAVATYMSELGLKGQRGFFASFQYVTLSGGQLLASLLSVIMLAFLSEQQLHDGAWRIPFVLGGFAAIVSLIARKRLDETLSNDASESKESGSLIALLKQHWQSFILVIGYTAAGSLCFYIITVYSKTYLTNIGIDSKVVGYIMTTSLFIFMISQPLFGIISDKIGRRAAMITFTLSMIIFIYPVMVLGMRHFAQSPIIIALLLIFLMMLLSFYTSISGLVKAEMFPPHLRALGVGVSYAIGNAIFGGSAPSVALQFKASGAENAFFIYVMVVLVICLLCCFKLPKEPKYLNDKH